MARRSVRASLVFTVLMASFAFPPAARAATTWVWPGTAPCNTTLQACVTNALGGDTVLVAQNGAIPEQINIVQKSLTLSAQTGFQPALDSATIQNSSGGATVNVTVSDIDFAHSVLISLSQGTGNVVTLDHVSAVASSADPGVYATVYVESTVNVVHSSVTMGGFYPGIEMTSPVSNANLTYNVVGNYVSGLGDSDASNGIYLSATDADHLTGNVYNNAIWRVGQGTSSTNGGIYLSARDSNGADFNVVGNTLNKITHAGVKVNDELHGASKYSLDLFNNIIAGTTGAVVDVTALEPATFAVRGGHNDLTKTKPPKTLGQSLGHNLSVTPKFANPANGNLALKSSSPVINKGHTCSPGGTAGPDAAGKNRRSGSSVDIGAYEFGAGKPGLVLIGNSGPDTLAGGADNDILCGNAGADKLTGGDGGDFLDGGPGNDLLCSKDGSSNDYLNGGKGTDAYRADPGDSTVSVEKPGVC